MRTCPGPADDDDNEAGEKYEAGAQGVLDVGQGGRSLLSGE